MDLRALPWRGQLPITVDITVPVQPAAEAGLPVRLGEISEVGFAEPRRQRAIGAGIAEKALAIFDKQGGWIGKSATQQGPHRQPNIALELGFGDTGRLKVLPIEIGDSTFAQCVERPATASQRRGNAEAGHGREYIGTEQRGVPGDRRPPVMTDDGRPLFPKRGDQRDYISDRIEDAVCTDVGRPAGAAETSHIRRNKMETRVRKLPDLIP